MYLRASIVLYMDEPAKNFYDTILAQEDAKKKLSMSEKYLPDKRITWQWIKKMIYSKSNQWQLLLPPSHDSVPPGQTNAPRVVRSHPRCANGH